MCVCVLMSDLSGASIIRLLAFFGSAGRWKIANLHVNGRRCGTGKTFFFFIDLLFLFYYFIEFLLLFFLSDGIFTRLKLAAHLHKFAYPKFRWNLWLLKKLN